MTPDVLDLAYGRGVAGDRTADVSGLLEEIDDPARRLSSRDGLAALARAVGGTAVVLHPTVWGPVRVPALIAELAASGIVAEPMPRAIAVAAAHADSGVDRCAVVETALLPETGDHWSVHAVGRVGGRWTLGGGHVTRPQNLATDPGWATTLAAAELIVVDGPCAAEVERARELLAQAFGVRTRAADGAAVRRFGVAVGPVTAADLLAGVPDPPAARRRLSARAPIVVAALFLAVAAIAAVVVHWPRTVEPSTVAATVGTATVTVPGDWRRSDLAGDESDAGAGRRAAFVAPDDGRRLIVVVSDLRSGSTPESVAESLRNRIAQRGDDAVAGFTADLDYAGRHVIAYREAPASGSPVHWYVTVSGDSQVSIGCQRGTGDDDVEGPCRTAVASVVVH